jgi:hypothetical protein
MAYNSCYMASLEYGTAATSLSMDECKEIQKTPVNAILPKMGINRNTKREVLFGTTKYGGLGLTHVAAVQGYGQLQYLLGHLRSDDTSGTLHQMLMEFIQLECGIEQEILSCDFDKYEKNILTQNWITECCRFLKLCGATVQTTGTWKPLRGRKGDVALMEVFAHTKITAKEMKDINRCRMYLQVFYLSDVTEIAELHIEAWIIKGKRDDTRSNKWEWPIQQRPPTMAWKVWRKAIGEAFTEEEDITYHLGEWYDEGGHQQIEWHSDAREGTLYRCNNGKWARHKAKQRGSLRFENECVTVSGPQGITHKAHALIRSSYIEVYRFFSLGKR